MIPKFFIILIFKKLEQNDNDTIYTCDTETCCEPISNLTDILDEDVSDDFEDFVDGACCESTDGSRSGGICCVVSLYSKANALK
jgi:hypothetical protein